MKNNEVDYLIMRLNFLFSAYLFYNEYDDEYQKIKKEVISELAWAKPKLSKGQINYMKSSLRENYYNEIFKEVEL